MTRRIARIARLLTFPALLAMGALATPSASAGNPCFHGYDMPPSSTGSGSDIKLMPCAFAPTVTVIAEGESVDFVNGPEYTHLVTGAAQKWGSAETEIQPNQTVTYTFDDAGVYPYACALHPGMSGAIVVGDLDDAVAAGAIGAVTSGGSTGADGATGPSTEDSTVAGAGASEAAAESASIQTSTVATLTLVLLGAGAGLIAGAAVVWLALRRRAGRRGILARAD